MTNVHGAFPARDEQRFSHFLSRVVTPVFFGGFLSKYFGKPGQRWAIGVTFRFEFSDFLLLTHRCLVKWLEVRCVCPMCNKPIAGPAEPHQSIGTLLDELV